MTIYDVPVEDTKFFPVSGDMMRQMKHEEEQRLKNGTGSTLAKESPDAADPNTYQGEQTVEHDTAILSPIPDVNYHPLWCNSTDCTFAYGQTHYSDPYTVHRDYDGDFNELDVKVRVLQFHFEGDELTQDPGVELEVDGIRAYLKCSDVEDLIRTLECAADDLKYIGGDR